MKKLTKGDVVRVLYLHNTEADLGIQVGDVGVVTDRVPTAYPDVYFKHLNKTLTLTSIQLKDGVQL